MKTAKIENLILNQLRTYWIGDPYYSLFSKVSGNWKITPEIYLESIKSLEKEWLVILSDQYEKHHPTLNKIKLTYEWLKYCEKNKIWNCKIITVYQNIFWGINNFLSLINKNYIKNSLAAILVTWWIVTWWTQIDLLASVLNIDKKYIQNIWINNNLNNTVNSQQYEKTIKKEAREINSEKKVSKIKTEENKINTLNKNTDWEFIEKIKNISKSVKNIEDFTILRKSVETMQLIWEISFLTRKKSIELIREERKVFLEKLKKKEDEKSVKNTLKTIKIKSWYKTITKNKEENKETKKEVVKNKKKMTWKISAAPWHWPAPLKWNLFVKAKNCEKWRVYRNWKAAWHWKCPSWSVWFIAWKEWQYTYSLELTSYEWERNIVSSKTINVWPSQ